MSNIKSVRIDAKVPFDFYEHTELALAMVPLMSPSFGLTYEWRWGGTEANAKGGVTTYYQLLIHGQEAVPFPYLDNLVEQLKAAGAKNVTGHAHDVEDGHDFAEW